MKPIPGRQRRHPETHRSVDALTQRGVSLLFAMLALVALSLAAVALVRSVDTSSLVVGNLGFKQDGTFYASQAAEEAIAWLDTNKLGTKLDSSDASKGYFPTAFDNLDPTNRRPADATRAVVDWNDDGCATPYASGSFAACLGSKQMDSASNTGTSARYVITRLCTQALGPMDPLNSCARPVNSALSLGVGRGQVTQYPGPGPETVEAGPYFRIVARTVGARNTVSYTETIVHF